jgi:hypothetical protein
LARECFRVLDLHGFSHEDGEHVIEKFVTDNFQELPVKIITGNSKFFIEKTHEITKRYKLFCYKEGYVNEGCWIIIKSQWF